MTSLILINGAPGAGKSTVAEILGRERPMSLTIDLDNLRHALGGWENDPTFAGRHARRLALAMIDEHLRAGYDVFMGQFLPKTDFIDALEQQCQRHQAAFRQFVLHLNPAQLRERLYSRALWPSRPEHLINNQFVGPDDAEKLAIALDFLRMHLPQPAWIDASGSAQETAARVSAQLGSA